MERDLYKKLKRFKIKFFNKTPKIIKVKSYIDIEILIMIIYAILNLLFHIRVNKNCNCNSMNFK